MSDTETHTVWGVRAHWPDGSEHIHEFNVPFSEKRARYMAYYWDRRPDGPMCTILYRTVTTTTTPWTEAENGGEA